MLFLRSVILIMGTSYADSIALQLKRSSCRLFWELEIKKVMKRSIIMLRYFRQRLF
jgi:hypothetical protein